MHTHLDVDDRVLLLRDMTEFLKKGSIGIIWCVYTTKPLSYEVSFNIGTTYEISAWVECDDIERIPGS